MGRSSKKNYNPSSASSAATTTSASSRAVYKEFESVDKLFNSYANGSSGLIERMKAEKQGYFTLEEWRRGLKSLKVDTTNKLKKALPGLEIEVRKPSNFVDFYSYAFQYCLTEEKQKTVDIESISELLNLVLGSQFRPLVDSLVVYLKSQKDYKVINMDQWMGFYRFCHEVSFPNFANYDESAAWPLILDNFVDWVKETQK